MTDKPRPPSRTAEQFIIRFPEGMRDRIAELAKQQGRSMNAEIVARLEESLVASSNPNIVAAVARLGIALAFKESEKVAGQLRTTVFASYVRSYGRQLLPFVASSNPEMATEVQRALQEADRVFEERHRISDDLATAAESIQKALAHVQRLVDADDTDPELGQLLDEAQQLGQRSK